MDWRKELERAAGLVAQARQVVEEFEGKEMPSEKAEQVQKLLGEAKELKARADQAKSIEEFERYFSEPVPSHPFEGRQEPGSEEKALKMQAFFKAIRAKGVQSLDAETKALVEDANGEILVPEELESEIYRELPKLTVIRSLATVRPIGTNRMRRRSLSEVQVGWGKLETGTPLTDSMPDTPSEEYQYVEDLYGLAKVGEDELDDSDVNLRGFIRDSFAQALAEAEDTGFVIGTGHSNQQPEGILSNSNVQRVPASTVAAVSTDDFLKLVYAVPAQYRRDGAFIMASSTELAIRLLKDKNEQYLWQPSVAAGRPNTFAGYPVYDQEDVPAIPTAAAAEPPVDVATFGSIRAAYRILDRLGMSIKILDQLYAEDGLIGFRVRRRVSGAIIRPNALRVLQVPRE